MSSTALIDSSCNKNNDASSNSNNINTSNNTISISKETNSKNTNKLYMIKKDSKLFKNTKISQLTSSTVASLNNKKSSFKNIINNCVQTQVNGDQRRIMDAADTLVSLAHSTTPTESKQIIELIVSNFKYIYFEG